MAFNFNWSPLTADAEFYSRARDLLTKALNKSPKPPIIVDDILVSEFNLGTVPPDLEILEIGDLAEDRFRGIFKMCYSGDAFLTLKTRVQVGLLLFLLSSYIIGFFFLAAPHPNLITTNSDNTRNIRAIRKCPRQLPETASSIICMHLVPSSNRLCSLDKCLGGFAHHINRSVHAVYTRYLASYGPRNASQFCLLWSALFFNCFHTTMFHATLVEIIS